MPKHKLRNTAYGIILEVNTVSQLNLASLCNTTKEQFYSQSFTKNVVSKLVPYPIYCF